MSFFFFFRCVSLLLLSLSLSRWLCTALRNQSLSPSLTHEGRARSDAVGVERGRGGRGAQRLASQRVLGGLLARLGLELEPLLGGLEAAGALLVHLGARGDA